MRPWFRPACAGTSKLARLRRLSGLLTLCAPLLLLSGCGHLFFYPSKDQFITPDQIGLQYEDVYLTTLDGETLHGWLLPAEGTPRGTVYFLHGNAENISTHIGNVMWLPAEGYQVFLLDYRGYGRSTGKPDIAPALLDVATGYHWLTQSQPSPLFILGQSLGGALTITFAAQQMPDLQKQVAGIVVDSAFASYRGIAREKLGQFWLTWAFQYPLSWLVPTGHDPVDHIDQIAPTPLLILHSSEDFVVPQHHGVRLFDRANPPKMFLATKAAHNTAFNQRQNREQVLRFFELTASSQPLHSPFFLRQASLPAADLIVHQSPRKR